MKGVPIEDAILQVLGSKRIPSSSSDKQRFRLLLSDGKYFISFAILATQIDDAGVSGEPSQYSIVKIKKCIITMISNVENDNKPVLVITEMETLASGDQTSKIGSPVRLPDELMKDVKNNVVSSTTSSIVSNVNSPHKNQIDTSMSIQGDQNISSTTVDTNVNSPHKNGADTNIRHQFTHPISSLSPYHNKWVIKARVACKSSIRTFKNFRGEGKLFSVDLIDKSGEIRATMFGDLVDTFYNLIELDKVYYVSKGRLEFANKQFNSLKNDYEIKFTPNTIVEECHEGAESVPQTSYNFVSIDKIADIEVDTVIDVLGACKSTSDLQMLQSRSTGRDLKKRELTLVDQSNNAITLSLWDTEAETFDGSSQPVLLLKRARVSEYGGGKTLSTNASTLMKINPDILEAYRLKRWFDNEGRSQAALNISSGWVGDSSQTQWINLKDVHEMGLGHGEKGDYFQVFATILLYRSENGIYKACAKEDCKKKVAEGNGMYHCDKCKREYPNFKYLLLGSANIADWSGNIWLSLFSSEAEKVLGVSSQAVGEAIERNPQALAEFADKAHLKEFLFKCRTKMDYFNDENRLKTVALRVDPVNYKEYNSYLISQINELLN
ncbi:replication protein A 70 kDa DNA-binding subunit-like isoform X2 [Photinus pyralis]|nr:replication protein A 70 kDa DNA-binding subunit-like isoform X2 [Photinus pyralis]